jgi:hypothetical protein
MGRKLRALAAFVYDLVIGDDWMMALGLGVAVAVTVAMSRTAVPSWWVLPTAILLLLPLSVWRTARRRA